MIQRFKKIIKKDSNLKELLTGSTITFIIKVIGMFVSYLVILLISRKHGAEGVGIYGLTYRILNSLAIIGALGLNVSVLRYVGQFNNVTNGINKKKEIFNVYFKLAFPFAIVLGLILFFFAHSIAHELFNNSNYTSAIKIAAIVLPFFTINLINVEFIRGLKLLKISEYLRSINTQLVIIFCLAFMIFNYGALNAVYALALGLIITFLFSFLYIWNYFIKNRVERNISVFPKKELLKTSMPMMITAVSSFILAYAGSFYLEIYSTTDQVGVFNVCLMLAQLASLGLIVVNTISAPKFSELYWNNKIIELKKVIYQSSKIIFWLSIAVSTILILFSKFILELFGSEFVIGFKTLIILVIGQMVNASMGSVGVLLNMTGNQKILRNIIIATTLLVLIGYFIVVPYYGMLGAAIIFMCGTIILNVTAAFYAYKKLNIITFYFPFIKI